MDFSYNVTYFYFFIYELLQKSGETTTAYANYWRECEFWLEMG